MNFYGIIFRCVSRDQQDKSNLKTLMLAEKSVVCYDLLMNKNNIRELKHNLLADWNILKEDFHFVKEEKLQLVRNGEIWWVGIGENVGVEINGKSGYFSRPVLVLKKLSRYGFMGIPLTSQPHKGSWYVTFEFQGKMETAVLAQAKVFSVSRLYGRIGQVPNSDLEKVRKGFLKLYSQ